MIFVIVGKNTVFNALAARIIHDVVGGALNRLCIPQAHLKFDA